MPTESQTQYNADLLFGSNIWKIGQKLTISNREVRTVSFYLKRVGTPNTNGGYITIERVSDAAPLASVAVSNAEIQALPTSYALFTKSITPTVINAEVRLHFGVNLPGNEVYAAVQNTDVKASENLTKWEGVGETWINETTQDCAYQYTYSGTGTVTTQSASSISGTTATGNGNITDLGAPNPTQHGHCWNTAGTPTTADSKTTNGAASVTGAFTSAMTGLTAGTKYYVRAYVTNAAGTSYGNEVTFTANKGTVSPTDPITRVSSIGWQFWSGKGGKPVYQMEITTGGTSGTYIPSVGSRQITSAVPQPEVPAHKAYTTQDYAAALGLSYPKYVLWVNNMQPLNLLKTYGHIPTYDEYVKLMAAQFKSGAK